MKALIALSLAATVAFAQDAQLERGRKAIHDRTGCYLVDYSFVETEAIKPGYVKDNRVYDVNANKSVKEWIIATDVSPTRIKMQHVLQGVDQKGQSIPGGILRHTGEDWEYNAKSLYDYQGKDTWAVKTPAANMWTRRITSLDDGLRYQCAAIWRTDTEYADWSCDNLAPITGREYRDFKRKDYQDLDRSSRLIVYDRNWLEREKNTKVIDEGGTKTPLVKEVGKTWYVRLPDAECKEAKEWAAPRLEFWQVTREAWDEVLKGDKPWTDTPTPKGKDSRYGMISDMEETWVKKNLKDPKVRAEARTAVVIVIEETQARK